jgi:hypothetical protein
MADCTLKGRSTGFSDFKVTISLNFSVLIHANPVCKLITHHFTAVSCPFTCDCVANAKLYTVLFGRKEIAEDEE